MSVNNQTTNKDLVSSIFPEKYRSRKVLEEFKNTQPPVNNMGGIIHVNPFISSIVDTGGNEKYSIINTPNKNIEADPNAAFVDWLNVSFRIDAFYKKFPECSAISMCGDDIVVAISEKLIEIFGFGVTTQCAGGKNFYEKSYVLGDGWGFLCIGGYNQKDTCLIMLNGSGCTAMRERDWEKKMVDFLTCVDGKITRVDVTADFFEGEYTVDKAAQQYLDGEFNNGGKEVSARQAGNWLKPDGTGRTLYIGKKENGKELCIYEKGLQLGGQYAQSFKDWLRVELRYGSKDRVIPFDILLYPGQYLSAGYPPLDFISKIQSKIKTAKAKAKVTYEKAKAVLKQQFGDLLYAIAGVDGTIKDVVGDDVPKRLITPDFKYRIFDDISINDYTVDEDYALNMSFI